MTKIKKVKFNSNTMTWNINTYIRPDLKEMKAYSSARSEFSGVASIFLDANENPFPTDYNRYPDPLQRKLKEKIASIENIATENIFLSNGSDELIDLLFRGFCEPKKDRVISLAPSYGMYSVSAQLNQIQYDEFLLNTDFTLDCKAFVEAAKGAKIIFLCSPNNPTGNAFELDDIRYILENTDSLLVVDEAYIDFSTKPSATTLLSEFPQLIVSQTFSKAYGLAGLRLGKAFMSSEIVSFLNKIKPPYNINSATQQIAIDALENVDNVKKQVRELIAERERIAALLETFPTVQEVFPSEANFILFRVENADEMYKSLKENGVIVRNRSSQILCENTLRVSIGTVEENNRFIELMCRK